VVVALLAVAGCTEDAPVSINGFPTSITGEQVGEEPKWARVARPDPGDRYFVRRRQLSTDPPAPVYNESGDLVGTFGCPTNYVTDDDPFTPLGKEPGCSPVGQR
jgi:hypothetical protein